MITNQQMADMKEHAEHHEDEREEQRFCMDEQWEDCHIQTQMQQQFLNTMMMMMSGNNVFSNAAMAHNTFPLSITTI